jgi:hypothetical protein
MTVLHRLSAMCSGAAAVVSSMAVLTPAPLASADLLPPADGYYTYSEPGQPPVKWELGSICIQANGTRAQPDYTDTTIQSLGCAVNVTSSTPSNLTPEEALLNFSDRARAANGLWTVSYAPPAGQVCPDGTTALLTQNFSWSEVTLTGTRTTLWGSECGKQPGMSKQAFTLSFLGPLNPPMVERFPDNCNYLAGRPSICS